MKSVNIVTGDQRDPQWWQEAVFYQIYVRSFADSDNNGVGDLRGVTAHLDYLSALGIDALWLTPFYRSPMADHGYDVADPRQVDPLFGELADFDTLLTQAHDRGIRVIIDVVPNHVSYRHPWFVKALSGRPASAERERFIFRNGHGVNGSRPPNNWRSVFGGPAWTQIVEPNGLLGQWYLHLFAPEQPDLNWNNPEVAADLRYTLRFWLDRGVDGFRIDVAHGMAKPVDLPDAPPYSKDYNGPPTVDNDGVHDIHRMIRSVLDEYPTVVSVGEVWVNSTERRKRYVRPDELHMVFDFTLAEADWEITQIRKAIDSGLDSVAGTLAPPCWVLSNHDLVRHVTRYGGGELGLARARAAAMVEFALPGVAYLYQGDELGLSNVDLPDEVLQDPIWQRSNHTERGRDGCRVPIPWHGQQPPFGFSEPGTTTWLPQPTQWSELTVATQEDQPDSMLNFYRQLLHIRQEHPGLHGDFGWLDAPDNCLAFKRGGGVRCLVNFSANPIGIPEGEILITSAPPINGQLPGHAAVWLS